jgi:putative SOS response-associated peptidase YedK
MPVILPVERHAQWLDGRGTLRELLVPYPAALRLTRLATRDTDELAAEAA